MTLSTLDWTILVAYFALSLGIGLAASRVAGKDYDSFFLGGRTMPWWLLGVSMVATTFAADTPNLIADIVRSNGVVGNWTWWAFLLTGMLTVFLYAKLWRRSGVLTDIEFYELRYSGKAAAFLRGFRAGYLGIFFNVIVMASVTLAMIKIAGALMGWGPMQTVLIVASITLLYSAMGGLTGVLLTDMVQFSLAIAGSIGAAWYIVTMPEVGGLQNMIEHVNVQDQIAFLPVFGEMTWQELMPIFIIPLAVQWWASYYPGAEPGGGGYIVQRMLSAKNEQNAVGATLIFTLLHYALRPWPWIIVALASLIVFPDLETLRQLYPHMPDHMVQNDLAYPAMLSYLPAGLLGLVVTSLVAAYMSTMSTQVNWGSSIVVNDIYRRFFRPEASEKRLVWVGRLWTVILMVLACSLALILESALQMFEVLLQVGAGTGLLLLVRWFWWRINAWSEITAMVVSFLIAVYFEFSSALGWVGMDWPAWMRLTVGVAVTTGSWLLVTFLTRPPDKQVLYAFYKRVQPEGPGWDRVLERARNEGIFLRRATSLDLPYALLAIVVGTIGIYAILFATGFFLYGELPQAIGCALLATGAAIGMSFLWPKLQFQEPEPAERADTSHLEEIL